MGVAVGTGVGGGVAVTTGVGTGVGVEVGVGVGEAHIATSVRSWSTITVKGLDEASEPEGRSPAQPSNARSHEAVITTVAPCVYSPPSASGIAATVPRSLRLTETVRLRLGNTVGVGCGVGC